VIVGGGLAGLAAAVSLGSAGLATLLLESRDRLGGRASSFVDPETGATVDNCQHVSMGCCTNLRQFCRTIGVDRSLQVQSALTFIGPDGSRSRFSAVPLPAPLHLAPAFLRLSYLSLREKWSLAIGLRRLARLREGDWDGRLSFGDWLRRQGQSERAIERFWEVVLVSALSESLDRIDIGLARKVFVDGFLRHRRGWEVEIPTVPLDQLYDAPARRWLTARGGSVRTQAAARRLHGDAQRVTSVELRSGELLPVSEIVLAVPHHRALELLPPDVAALPELSVLNALETAPITSLHLTFDRPITELPHAVLVGRLSQWLFRRPATAFLSALEQGPRGAVAGPDDPGAREMSARQADRGAPAAAHGYQVVISASRALHGRSQEEVRDAVLGELRSIWPAATDARLLHWRMVTERRAVFSATPGCDRLRPAQATPVPNLFLAGDWTSTGWPSTMEGAVRSGYLAAEALLSRRGAAVQFVRPDLPVAWLSRLAFGL